MSTQPDNAEASDNGDVESPDETTLEVSPEEAVPDKPRKDEALVKPAKAKRAKTKPAKTKPAKTKREKKPVGLFTVFLAALIAAGLGAAGGGALSRVLDKDVQTADPAQLSGRIAALESDLQAVKAVEPAPMPQMDMRQIEALSARITALENMPMGGGDDGLTASDMTAMLARLDALDKAVLETGQQGAEPNPRLLALEETVTTLSEKPLIDPAIEQRIAALENTPPAETNAADLEPLTARIAAIENSLQNTPDPVDLAPLMARLESLEAKVASASAARAALPIPDFPKDAVLTAIVEAEYAAKGWAGRLLGKHVRTRDEAIINAVNEIALLASEGQLETALSRIAQLPEAGQTAAKNWTDIVSLQRTLP